MAYCMNCGKELPDGAKFCAECGTAVNDTSSSTSTQRKTVYDGEIHKCPNCGEVLQSMTAICPACGHEINAAKVTSALREFVDEINECDKIIANTPKKELPPKGWKTWKKSSRILWVILNIFTSCIPLVVYLIFPLIKPLLRNNTTPVLSSMEQRKATLIENFTFPNDRESILEALLFTKSKIAFLATEKANEKNAFWLRLWTTKATQLHQKASIILKNDPIAEGAYTDIIESKKEIDKKVRVRAGIGAGIIIVYISFICINGSLFNGINSLFGNINEFQSSLTSKPSDDTSDVNSSTNSNDNEYGVIGGADSSVEITVQNNDYLEVTEFGWFISGKYLECIIAITNTNSEYAIEYPTYRITAYDENDKILGTEEQVLSVIYPKQNFYSYSLCFELSKTPAKIAITLLEPDDYNITSASMLEHPSQKQMVGRNVSVTDESIVGEIYNPNDYAVDSAMVTVVFKNDKGEIIFGEQDFIDQIPAGGTAPFEVYIYSDDGIPSNCEVYAYFW